MSVVTEPLTVTAVAPEDALTLTVTATADRTEVFEQPGLVRFTLEIANTSQVDATDVRASPRARRALSHAIRRCPWRASSALP